MTIHPLAKNSNGGTERIQREIYNRLPRELLAKFQIVFSRLNDIELDRSKIRIYYAHDLPGDPGADRLKNGGWQMFHKLIFVSNWQMQAFIQYYNIEWDRCVVMRNAITPISLPETWPKKHVDDPIKLIYHTTPHRGLVLLAPVFEALSAQYNLELDVYSSFKIYGWGERDEQYKELFERLESQPNVRNHGTVPNDEVRTALVEADIFAYPSIWVETSCISLIEAMSAECLCVHSNLGALGETGAGLTDSYQYHNDIQAHAGAFAEKLVESIEMIKMTRTNQAFGTWVDRRLSLQSLYTNVTYEWLRREAEWKSLLWNLAQIYEQK